MFRPSVAVEGLNAIATEALGKYLDSRFATDDQFKVGTAQIIGVLAGAVGGGDPNIASWVAGNAERYNQQLHREAADRLKNGFDTLHKEGKYLNLEPDDVLKDLQNIVDGERNPSKLNPEVVAFLNQFPPAMLRELFLEPTETERLIQLGIEIGFPSIAGKGNAAATVGGKVIKEVSEAAEKKFADELAKDLASGVAVKLNQSQQQSVTRISNTLKNFKDHDIVGTLKDMAGTPVPKEGGGFWNHLQEMSERLISLRKHSDKLKDVNNAEAQAARQAALDAIKRIEEATSGVGI